MFEFLHNNHKKITYGFLGLSFILFLVIFSCTVSCVSDASEVREALGYMSNNDDRLLLGVTLVSYNCHLAFSILSMITIIVLIILMALKKIEPQYVRSGVGLLFAFQGLDYAIPNLHYLRVFNQLGLNDSVPFLVGALGGFGIILLLIGVYGIIDGIRNEYIFSSESIAYIVIFFMFLSVIVMDFVNIAQNGTGSILPNGIANAITSMVLIFSILLPIYYLSYNDEFIEEKVQVDYSDVFSSTNMDDPAKEEETNAVMEQPLEYNDEDVKKAKE